ACVHVLVPAVHPTCEQGEVTGSCGGDWAFQCALSTWRRLSGALWSVAKESFRFSKDGGGVHDNGMFWQGEGGIRCQVRLPCHLFPWTGRPLVEEAVDDACPGLLLGCAFPARRACPLARGLPTFRRWSMFAL